MIKTMMMLSMIFLVGSCRSVNTRLVCNQLRKHEIKPLQMCDISFKKNRCRCRDFDFNNWKELSEPVNYPIEHCEGVAGFFVDPDIGVEVRPNIRALANLKENLCSP